MSNPEVSTLKPGSINSFLFNQEWILLSFKRHKKNANALGPWMGFGWRCGIGDGTWVGEGGGQ